MVRAELATNSFTFEIKLKLDWERAVRSPAA
jgi:hypothetical protein